jgi:pimeloyl-ACP methyl ester carboxylesterase
MKPQVAEVASADGVPVRYEVRGSGEPALVLVHGWSGSRRCWQAHSNTLAATNRVVVVDLPGFGESGSGRTAWSMQAYGRDVAAVLDSLPDKTAVLVAHSLGAAPALEAACMAPERVVGVILVDILHDPELRRSDESIEQQVTWWKSIWGDPGKIRPALYSQQTPEAVVRRFVADRPKTPPGHYWDILRSVLRWGNSDRTRSLASLRVPLEAINNDTPETKVDAMRKYVPGFRVALIPGAGHMGILTDRPEEFDQLLLAAVRRFTAGRRHGAIHMTDT